MWQLSMTNAAKEWTSIGSFDSVTAAARPQRQGVFIAATSVQQCEPDCRRRTPVSS